MLRALSVLAVVTAARVAFAQVPTADEARGAAERVCAARDPACDWVSTYDAIERSTLLRALAARGYEVEPSPWGKVIAKIHVYNEKVFAEKNWLQFFNIFHITTREHAIAVELTINEGEVWDQARVEESARRLRDPLFSSVVGTLPVKSKEPGKVDLFVITRDVWSIRLNTVYTFQEGSLTNLQISLSENNFLGQRELLAAALVMDQGTLALGPLFIDKNFLGRHLDLRIRVDDRFTRRNVRADPMAPCDPTNPAALCSVGEPANMPAGIEDHGGLHSEGTDSAISLARPLWALASEWGWRASFSHLFAPVREFFGTGVYAYTDPTTGTVLPREYYLKRWSASANVVRQWGTDYKFQLAIGHSISSQRPELLPGFATAFPGLDPSNFIRDVFPRSEVTSTPYIEFSLFEPSYRVSRNVSTYQLGEDFRLGPSVDLIYAQGLTALGSTYNFENPALSLAWTFPWCHDGYVTAGASMGLRFQNTTLNNGAPTSSIDNTASANVAAVTPNYRYLRIVAQAGIATRWNDTQNSFLTIGSDSGLRGFDINQFIGQRRVSGMIEARSLSIPGPWFFHFLACAVDSKACGHGPLRFGAVLFYEVGGAADTLATMQLHHDVGIGLRMLVPQTSRELWRFDLAFPLDSTPMHPAGLPHFIAGFGSYF